MSMPVAPIICGRIPWGIFIGQVAGEQVDGLPQTHDMTCGWASATGTTRVLFGCGPSTWDADKVQCGNFTLLVQCTAAGSTSSWTCPYQGAPGPADLLYLQQTDPRSGILCCRQ